MRFRRRPVRRDEELACIELDGRRTEYVLKRSSARRSLSLKLNREGIPQINAPWSMPLARIEAFLRSHAGWLGEQMRRRQALLHWHDGMTLPYLGGELRLAWQPSGNLLAVREQAGMLLCLADEPRLGPAVADWYRGRASAILAGRLEQVCQRLGRAVPPWRLSDARTRWGSLSVKGVVGLNWRLVKAPPEVIDYVICHELAHFRRRDHSASFWREVGNLCPGYEALRDQLRRDGARYLEF